MTKPSDSDTSSASPDDAGQLDEEGRAEQPGVLDGGSTPPVPTARRSTRRHLIVLAVLVVAFAGGVTLVVTGRSKPTAAPPETTAPSPALRWLGSFPTKEAATRALGALDPTTLQRRTDRGPSSTSGTTLKAATETSEMRPTLAQAKRCAISVKMQSADRNLGDLHASIALAVGGKVLLAQSFALPASGKEPGGTRVMVSDVTACQVQFAYDVAPPS